jgi:LPXTG-motif cell wall-anchored protein
MRKLPLTFAAVAALTLASAPAAFATNGDNGTVKIHDAETGEELRRNEPHVCTFYLQGFGFDEGQEVTWEITEMPPTGTQGTVADSGELTLDPDGAGRTGDLTLPDGHYRLTWQFEGENGSAKHKVFWVECGDDEGTTGESGDGGASGESSTGESSTGESSTGSASGETSGETSGDTSGAATSGGTTGGTTGESPQGTGGQDGGDLAETGSSVPVVALSAGAAALLAAGGWLALRRRRSA